MTFEVVSSKAFHSVFEELGVAINKPLHKGLVAKRYGFLTGFSVFVVWRAFVGFAPNTKTGKGGRADSHVQTKRET